MTKKEETAEQRQEQQQRQQEQEREQAQREQARREHAEAQARQQGGQGGQQGDVISRQRDKDPLEMAKDQVAKDEERQRKIQEDAARHTDEQGRVSGKQPPKVEDLPKHLQPQKPRRFKVTEGRMISTGGVVTELRKGTIVSDDGSGREHVDTLLAQGVALEELKEPSAEEKKKTAQQAAADERIRKKEGDPADVTGVTTAGAPAAETTKKE
jgi:hypothetical protein